MDREDERSGRMEHIHHGLRSAYRQFPDTEYIKLETLGDDEDQDKGRSSGEPNGEETCEEQESNAKRIPCKPSAEFHEIRRFPLDCIKEA